MNKFAGAVALLFCLGTTTVVFARQAPKADDTKPPEQPPSVSETPGLSEAEKAVIKVDEAFVKAYNAGDAKGIAELFVEEAEILRDDEDPIKGRKAIQEMFEETFADSPGSTIELSAITLRFLTPDLAIEEGTATVTHASTEEGTPGEVVSSRYSVHYTKQGNKWFQASIRDVPDRQPTVEERLQKLEWLIGEWVDEKEDGRLEISSRWDESGKYILRDFYLKLEGSPAMSGTERIGWDPLSKQIKSWVFDSEGGYNEGLWTESPNEWVAKVHGVLPDGRVASATRVVTIENKDRIRIRSVDRVAGGVARPDIEEMILVRKPPAPGEKANKPKQETPK